MSAFLEELNELKPSVDEAANRQWIYVPYDQLTHRIGPLAGVAAEEAGIVMVETTWKPTQRKYHKQKLALILANQRHFALEQARRGVAVHYLFSEASYAQALKPVIDELGPLRMMEAAERELRFDLHPLAAAGRLAVCEHSGWLTAREQFDQCRSRSDGSYRMDSFYRAVRRDTGILMTEGGDPEGGKFSFDAHNRKPWKGSPQPPRMPTFEVDAIKAEIGELVEELFSDHPGTLDLAALPATAGDAETLWSWAKEHCFEHFGPYEDAMTTQSSGLFHTRISALLNLHRMLPRQVIEEAVQLEAPLQSREGFVRQILGWREFVRWVHLVTDGFRHGPDEEVPLGEARRDLAEPSHLGADRPLPDAFWARAWHGTDGTEEQHTEKTEDSERSNEVASGLHCLDHVVDEVWREGYSHHITRLMVLSNIATLLDVSPRELTDWFWVAYTDAYDWVVEPNVLGMGTFAVGELMTTKPYVSGANYIHKMSDYCSKCAFDPKKNCPITSLYWQFLARHREVLDENPRMNLVMASAKKRPAEKKAHDRAVFEWVSETLDRGERLDPDQLPSP